MWRLSSSCSSTLRFVYGRSLTTSAAIYNSGLTHMRIVNGPTFRNCPKTLNQYRLRFLTSTSVSSIRDGGEQEAHTSEVDTLELAELVQKGETLLIDVREPYEVEDTGTLAPTAINIPLGEVGSALHMSAEQFQQEYKSSQPSKNRDIVFYCMAGVRSLVAVELAHNLGYTNVRHYISGWIGWQEYMETHNNDQQ